MATGIGMNVFEDMFIPDAQIKTPALVTDILMPWTEMEVVRGQPAVIFIGQAASAALIAPAVG